MIVRNIDLSETGFTIAAAGIYVVEVTAETRGDNPIVLPSASQFPNESIEIQNSSPDGAVTMSGQFLNRQYIESQERATYLSDGENWLGK